MVIVVVGFIMVAQHHQNTLLIIGWELETFIIWMTLTQGYLRIAKSNGEARYPDLLIEISLIRLDGGKVLANCPHSDA